MEKLTIIVCGYIGLYPTGGATIDYIQFPLGLQKMGHNVYYLEDSMQYPVFQQKGRPWDDVSDSVEYLRDVMDHFGFKDRWAYRDIASGKCFGMPLSKLLAVCKKADLFLNISCSAVMRDEYYRIPKRILLDSDPMFTQVTYLAELEDPTLKTSVKSLMETHNYFFSFGENIGKAGCRVPEIGKKWETIRQPVCMDLWSADMKKFGGIFSSVMNWSGRSKLQYNNQFWGQKDVEFEKFVSIPLLVPEAKFRVVINPPLNPQSNYDPSAIKDKGWEILSPKASVGSYEDYIAFINNSDAEFSIAKETYVKSESGWFSCRSACYLAAGKPVVAQETAWSKYIPTGKGLFSFTNMDEAADAARHILSEPAQHAAAAAEIAVEYFDSRKVLGSMLQKLN